MKDIEQRLGDRQQNPKTHIELAIAPAYLTSKVQNLLHIPLFL